MPIPVYDEIVRMQDEEQNQDKGETDERKKQRKPPPIVLVEKEQYATVKEALERDVMEAEGKDTRGGINIFTKRSEDYRKAIKCMTNYQAKFHSFMLAEKKPLRIVIRGVSIEVEEETVKEELEGKRF